VRGFRLKIGRLVEGVPVARDQPTAMPLDVRECSKTIELQLEDPIRMIERPRIRLLRWLRAFLRIGRAMAERSEVCCAISLRPKRDSECVFALHNPCRGVLTAYS
jgi:hypothetical protein